MEEPKVEITIQGKVNWKGKLILFYTKVIQVQLKILTALVNRVNMISIKQVKEAK
jgi:hypothetical protein